MSIRRLAGLRIVRKFGGDHPGRGCTVVVMRVMFVQVAYPERHYALVARDDGVVYRIGGGPATHGIPHDLVHYTVEDSLGLSDGMWGAIAGGVVFRSMTHVSGRRPLTCAMLRNTTPPAIAPQIPSLSPSESSTV